MTRQSKFPRERAISGADALAVITQLSKPWKVDPYTSFIKRQYGDAGGNILNVLKF